MYHATPLAAAFDPVIGLLRDRCCVNVRGESPGSGFFISPTLIITCAHVVGRVPLHSLIELRQGGRHFQSRLIELLDHENDDLALLEVAIEHAGVPIPFGNDAWMDDRLILVGYPASGEDQAIDSLSAIYEARTDSSDERTIAGSRFLHKFKSAHVVAGFSGGPLINLDSMQAIGIVSHTRSTVSAVGGWAIPIELACNLLRTIALTPQSTTPQAPTEWGEAVQARARLITERRQRSQVLLSGQPSFLPHATAIGNFIASYLGSAQSLEPFGGRDREMAALDDWARDDTVNPYLIVTAPLGRGKSALLVQWCARLLEHRTESYRVVFVPVSIRYDLNTSAAVFSALGTRLSTALSVSSPLASDAPADLWREQVSQLLSADLPPGVRLVVILDGVDESAGWELGPGTFPVEPAPRVKVVLSARDRADRVGAQWLETLNWVDPRIARLMPLTNLDRAGIENVLQKALPPALFSANPTLIDELWRLSAGDPLVLNLYAKALRDRQAASDKPIRIDELPQVTPGLEGYFTRWWIDQLRLWQGNRSANLERATHALFNVLALAFGPLERSDLLNLLRRIVPDISGDDLDQALSALARFVTRNELGNAYVLGHPRFGAFRLARLKADGDYDRYESAFLQWGKLLTEPIEVGLSTSRPSRYIVRYYASHLDRSRAPAEDFLLLLSAGWRAAWQCHAEDLGSFAIVLDEVRERLSRFDREAIARGRSATFTGQQLRCGIELAELRDTSRSVAPEMLEYLVKFRLWSISAAFDHMARLEHEWDRVACLAKIIPYATHDQLGRVNQLIDDLSGEPHHHLADVFSALCARLSDLALGEAARALVPRAPPGLPRATVLMILAKQSQGKDRESLLLASFDEFGECFGYQRTRLVRMYAEEFMSEHQSRFEGLGKRIPACIQAYIEQKLGAPINPQTLASPIKCQFLEYVLPFMPNSERAQYIAQYFSSLLTEKPDARFWYVAEFFRDCGHLIDTSLIPQALEVVDHISKAGEKSGNQFDIASAVLALWPSLTTEERGEWTSRLLSVVSQVYEWPSINDRNDCFELLGKMGFTTAALDIIEAGPREDWNTADLLASIAPYLSEQETRRALALIREIRLETQEKAQRAVLARLSSFSAESALDAQRHAGNFDVGLEAHLASAAIRVGVTKDAGAIRALLDKLLEVEDPELRFSLLQVCAPLFGALKGRDIARITRSFTGARSISAPLGVEIFAILAEKIDIGDLADPEVLSLVSHLLREVPNGNKIELMAPYFAMASRADLNSEIVDLVASNGSGAFEIPCLAAIFGVALGSKEADLISWACHKAHELQGVWLRLAAYAALRQFLGDNTLKEAWRETVTDLSELEILVHAPLIAGFLRQVPEAERGEFFGEIARHCASLELADVSVASTVGPAAIAALAAVAPIAWLDEWQPKIGGVRSSSLEGELRSAFGIRYAELGYESNVIALMRRVDAGTLANMLNQVGRHLSGEYRKLALELLLGLPRVYRLRAWAGLNSAWNKMTVAEAFEMTDHWLRRVPRQGLRQDLLDLIGISEGLCRVSDLEATEIAQSVAEGIAAKHL